MLITFEGGEGAGKTTQIARLSQALERRGQPPLLTREPGGTPVSTRIREVLLDPTNAMQARTELLLFNAARAELVETVVRPALASGQVVIIDRFVDSTRAYQGAGRGLDPALIEAAIHLGTGGLEPDLTLLLDLDPTEGLARASKRGAMDRLEQADLDFHTRLRGGFLALAASKPRFRIIDASAAPDAVHAQVWREVTRALHIEPERGSAGH